MTKTPTSPANLTEGQLYDEANEIMFAKARCGHVSEQQEARLVELEAEFFARHAAALAA